MCRPGVCQKFYKKSENKKFSNADAEDILAPPLFRGGGQACEDGGVSPPK